MKNKYQYPILLLLIIGSLFSLNAQSDPCGQMNCLGRLNLVLDGDCSTEITPGLMLTGTKLPDSQYDVVIRDEAGRLHENSFDASDAGQRFQVTVINPSCNDAQCWGYVNVENKNIPSTLTSFSAGMCGESPIEFISIDSIKKQLADSCWVPITDIVETIETTGDKCDGQLIIREVRGGASIDGNIRKVILRLDTFRSTPLDTSMVVCPGSMDLISAKKLDCEDLDGRYPTPEVVASLMGERLAYPYVDKGFTRDSTTITVKVDRDSMKTEKIQLEGGVWALFDVVDKYQIDSSYQVYDTTYRWIPLKDGDQTCNLVVKYDDEVFEGCVGELSKIKRTWTILDWCQGNQKVCVQWIILSDESAPVIKIPEGLVKAPVAPWTCTGEIDLSNYVEIVSGNCSGVRVEYKQSGGLLNGTVLSELSLSDSPISVEIRAVNGCGVESKETLFIKVSDESAPVAIAEDQVNVNLTGDVNGDGGVAKVEVPAIDAGSHDSGCGEIEMCILLDEELQDPLLYSGYWSNIADISNIEDKGLLTLAGPGTHLNIDGQLLYNQHGCHADGYIYLYEVSKTRITQLGRVPYVICKEYVKFCCEDLGEHRVALVVSDESPHSPFGVSWTNVVVEDKSAGQWYCIEEDIPCAYVSNWQPEYKARYGSDFCGLFDVREITREEDVSKCGDGSVTIIWGAYDNEGNEVSTTECIYNVSGRKAFNPYEIKWPKHYNDDTYEGVIRECEKVNIDENAGIDTFMIVEYQERDILMGGSFECSIMETTGEPSWCTEACGLIGSTYEDEVIEAGDACKKIIRRWTIIDWCTLEANGSNVDDENDGSDSFQAVDDAWLRINAGIENALTDFREATRSFVNGKRVTDLDCESCEKPNGAASDVYFRYTNVDEDGYYTYDQVIKIVDYTAPVIDAPARDTISIISGASFKGDDFNDCMGYGFVSASALDICGEETLFESEDLTWRIEVYNEDGEMVALPKTVFGSTAEMSTGMAPANTVHYIIWKVIDGCGNTGEVTTEVLFADNKNPTPVCIQDLSTTAMNTDGTVEIWASDFDRGSFDNCGEVKFSFLVDDNGDITDDIDEGSFVPSVTFDCDDLTAGQGGTMNLSMYVTDDFGNTDFCFVRLRIDDNPDVDVCVDGNLEAALIAGELRTPDGDMIEDARVNLQGSSKQMSTEVDGKYSFENSRMGYDYGVTPAKNGDYLNGVTTLDLVMMQRHILGLESLPTPYKVIAADVSNDKRVTALDLVQLRKVILGESNEFPDNESWRFVDADQTFENDLQPWPFKEVIEIESLNTNRRNDNFIGVKIGDVSGNAIANSAIAGNGRSNQVLSLQANQEVLEIGNTTTIDISSDDAISLVGLQFTMDLSDVNFIGVKPGLIEVSEYEVASIDDNTVTFAWSDVIGEQLNGAPLFSIVVEAINQTTVADAIKISSEVTTAAAYGADAQEHEIDFYVDSKTGLVDKFQLLQNTPNPFKEATDISFVLSEEQEVTLTVFDITGRVLVNQTSTLGKGKQTITVDAAELGVNSGVLYYQVETDDQIATKKMLLIE